MSNITEDATDEDFSPLYFSTTDYIMLLLVLIIPFLFGLHSAIRKKKSTIEEYILGNRKLKTIPVSLSIIASVVSGLTVVGLPSEVYFHGCTVIYGIFSLAITYVIFYCGYLPVFYKLKVTTLYEYLERRFDNRVRAMCATFYIFRAMSWMSILLCLSSLTLTQVSGINFYAIVIVSGVLLIFYTSVGGIRTVIWTDVVQTVFMIVGVGTLAIKGTIDVGGLTVLWERNRMYGRLDTPSLALDFFEKYSFWEILFGQTLLLLVEFGLNQETMQRCSSVPTLKNARNCLILSWFGANIFYVLSMFNGLVLFATFFDCDPLTSQKIKARDQLIPLLTTKILRNFPGLPGLFVAALSSATLSTLSTILNSLSAVILQDFYKPFFSTNFSEYRGHVIMKSSVIIFGLLSTGLAFLVVKLGSIFQVINSLSGAANGPILGIFTIGIFIPLFKSKAVIIASLTAFLISCWISIEAIVTPWPGKYIYKTKPLQTYGCEVNITVQNTTNTDGDVLFVYKISQLWYTAIGFIITMILATILSVFMDRNNVRTMNRDLISPLVQPFIKGDKNTAPIVNVPLLNCNTDK